jgi:hypothetical protein
MLTNVLECNKLIFLAPISNIIKTNYNAIN